MSDIQINMLKMNSDFGFQEDEADILFPIPPTKHNLNPAKEYKCLNVNFFLDDEMLLKHFKKDTSASTREILIILRVY